MGSTEAQTEAMNEKNTVVLMGITLNVHLTLTVFRVWDKDTKCACSPLQATIRLRHGGVVETVMNCNLYR